MFFVTQKANKQLVEISAEENDWLPEDTIVDHNDRRILEATKYSTEEYIKRLESEIRILKGIYGKGSSSRTILLSESDAWRRENMDGKIVRLTVFTVKMHKNLNFIKKN